MRSIHHDLPCSWRCCLSPHLWAARRPRQHRALHPGENPALHRHPPHAPQGAPGAGRTVSAVGKESIFSAKKCFLLGNAKDFYLRCFALLCCPKSVASWKHDTGFWETAGPRSVSPWGHLMQLRGWQQQALEKGVKQDKRSSSIYYQ